MRGDWQPVGHVRGRGRICSRGEGEFRLEIGDFISKVFASMEDARILGWAAYCQSLDNKAKGGAGPARVMTRQAAGKAAEVAPGPRRRGPSRKRACPDASTDGMLKVEEQQQQQQQHVEADQLEERGRKPAKEAAAVGRHKRRKHNASAYPTKTAGAETGTEQTAAGAAAMGRAEQTPSAATDAATVPPDQARKQQDRPAPPAAAAAAAGGTGKPVKGRRGCKAAAGAAPAPRAAAGAWQQPRQAGRQAKRVFKQTAAAPAALGKQAAAAQADASDPPPPAKRPLRATRARAAAAAAEAEAATAAAPQAAPVQARRTVRARRTRHAASPPQPAAAAADPEAHQPLEDSAMMQSDEAPPAMQPGRQAHPGAATAAAAGQEVSSMSYESQEAGSDHSCGSDRPPSSAPSLQPGQEQQHMDESAGSNWLPQDSAHDGQPPTPPAGNPTAAAAAKAAATAAALGLGGSNMLVCYQGSKACAAGLDVEVQEQLGKGGFGAVYRVLVKATGANSLSGLKLSGPLANSLSSIIKQGKARAKRAAATAARAAGGRGRVRQPARSQAGSNGNGGSSDGGSSGGLYVPMALKVALSFDEISHDMQVNFRQPSAFESNVNARMSEEYEVMTACASSPFILDAFCLGTVLLEGCWRTGILMELSELGDAERVFLRSSPGPFGSVVRGVSSVQTQCIVRQAAMALKDLHSLAGSMHLDVKVNNLLVFGSRDAPIIRLGDFGCAKKRSSEPRYGPASGTKDWQAPEQMAAGEDAHTEEGPPAGRLDFCTDSWGLGLLVLSLRKGQQPFWWLKQEGKLPSEMADELRHSLHSPSSPYAQDSPRGSKLTRQETAFVSSCLASSSRQRAPVKELLESHRYLSSRYRGG